MFLKMNWMWILLFGSLIGLNEALIGSFAMPYRSSIVNAISLAMLVFARLKLPRPGVSTLIVLIAVLFKFNNYHCYSCPFSVQLNAPLAMLFMGISFELAASLFMSSKNLRLQNLALSCILTIFLAFGIFGIMNTYVTGHWGADKLIEHLLVKATLAAVFSSAIVITVYSLKIRVKLENESVRNKYLINGLLGVVIVALWIVGSLATF